MDDYCILVDGSNVAHFRQDARDKPMVSNLEIMLDYLDYLELLYVDVHLSRVVITDASLKYQIDDRSTLESMYKKYILLSCPSGRKADDFIIAYYLRHPETTAIITNDTFRDHGFFRQDDDALCKFMIINGEFVCPDIERFMEKIVTKTGMELEGVVQGPAER